MLVMCDYLFQRVHDIESYTVNQEYLVSKIFQIFARVRYYLRIPFIPKYTFIFEFLNFVRILLYENCYSSKIFRITVVCLHFEWFFVY